MNDLNRRILPLFISSFRYSILDPSKYIYVRISLKEISPNKA